MCGKAACRRLVMVFSCVWIGMGSVHVPFRPKRYVPPNGGSASAVRSVENASVPVAASLRPEFTTTKVGHVLVVAQSKATAHVYPATSVELGFSSVRRDTDSLLHPRSTSDNAESTSLADASKSIFSLSFSKSPSTPTRKWPPEAPVTVISCTSGTAVARSAYCCHSRTDE